MRLLVFLLIKLAEYILLNSPHKLLAIHLVDFSATLRTRKLRLMSSLYKDTIRVRGVSSLVGTRFEMRDRSKALLERFHQICQKNK